jgi:hypothetical protein
LLSYRITQVDTATKNKDLSPLNAVMYKVVGSVLNKTTSVVNAVDFLLSLMEGRDRELLGSHYVDALWLWGVQVELEDAPAEKTSAYNPNTSPSTKWRALCGLVETSHVRRYPTI